MDLGSAQTVTGPKKFNPGALLNKGIQVFDIRAYEAVGDGVADDYPAIAAALAAANAVGGQLLSPVGDFIVPSANLPLVV